MSQLVLPDSNEIKRGQIETFNEVTCLLRFLNFIFLRKELSHFYVSVYVLMCLKRDFNKARDFNTNSKIPHQILKDFLTEF